MLGRFAMGLQPFLAETTTVEQARRMLIESRQRRAGSFLQIVSRAVFGFPERPYAWLFSKAGLDMASVARMVGEHGVEGALERWMDLGIYLTLDEFKGRVPIRRFGEERAFESSDFDNPLLRRDIEAATSGSSGARRRLAIDLDLLRYETALHCLLFAAVVPPGSPFAIWRPVPPGTAGIKRVLSHLKAGGHIDHWFTMQPFSLWRPNTMSWPVTAAALLGCRLAGRPFPVPEYVPLDRAGVVANWLASSLQRGVQPYLDTTCSAAVRVLQAAQEQKLSLTGTFIRTGSEPLTPSRAALFAEAGCTVRHNYSISETGPIAMACPKARTPDDAHLIDGKIAILQREGVPLVKAPPGIAPLYLTTLLTSTPKLMINVESGDYAEIENFDCGCPFGELGFITHLHNIRSYEKLSGAGVHFTGQVLLQILEEVLPARFGGDPTDYQFVEDEVDGLPIVWLLVHPRRGEVDENEVARTVLDALAARSTADAMMAGFWRQGEVVRVKRQAPEATATGKILALHQARPRRQPSPGGSATNI